MSWQGIVGHDEVVAQFRRRLDLGRLASTFLFVGPTGIGKRTFAMKLAQALLCTERDERLLEPCGTCPSCLQVKSQTHPDLLLVAKPDDKNTLPLDLFIGDDEHRMREGLCHDISLRPMMSARRVAIIDDADFLSRESANCLLKTLEEPPPRSVMILIGTSVEQQLPTIRSRAQIVRFQPLSLEVVAELLVKQSLVADRSEAERLATHSEGSLAQALELADPELWSFRDQLYVKLSEPLLDSVSTAKMVLAFVEAAGKEAVARRVRGRRVIGFAADYYRQLARVLAGGEPVGDDELNQAVLRRQRSWPGDADTAADCVERCLEAIGQIDRYVNQSTLFEGWLDGVSSNIMSPPAARPTP